MVTRDPVLATRMRKVKGQGQSFVRRYWHEELGFNYRMTNIEAAIGLGAAGAIARYPRSQAAHRGALSRAAGRRSRDVPAPRRRRREQRMARLLPAAALLRPRPPHGGHDCRRHRNPARILRRASDADVRASGP